MFIKWLVWKHFVANSSIAFLNFELWNSESMFFYWFSYFIPSYHSLSPPPFFYIFMTFSKHTPPSFLLLTLPPSSIIFHQFISSSVYQFITGYHKANLNWKKNKKKKIFLVFQIFLFFPDFFFQKFFYWNWELKKNRVS